MWEATITLFASSAIWLFVGYNFAFNTRKTLNKYIQLSGYKEGSYFHDLLKNNNLWILKLGGIIIISFSIIFFCAAIVIFVKG